MNSFHPAAKPSNNAQFYHVGPRIQSGYGFGSFLSNIFKSIFGIGKKIATSSIGKEVINAAKDATLSTSVNVIADAIKGDNVKESIGQNLTEARDTVSKALKTGLSIHKDKQKKRKINNLSEDSGKKRKAAVEKDLFDD
jgi:hypothetical protein